MSRSTRKKQSKKNINNLFKNTSSIVRPELIGTIFVVVAAASIPFLIPLAGLIADARDELIRLFGLHTFTLVLIMASIGIILAFRKNALLVERRRHLVGLSFVLLFLSGILGYWYPDRLIGTTDLAIFAAGGKLGRSLTNWPEGILIWVSSGIFGFILLWPHSALEISKIPPKLFVQGLSALWAKRIDKYVIHVLALASTITFKNIKSQIFDRFIPTVKNEKTSTDSDFITQIAGPKTPELTQKNEVNIDEMSETPIEEDTEIEKRPAAQLSMDMQTPADEVRHSDDGWQLPPINVLAEPSGSELGTVDNDARADLIIKTLASFGVDATVVQINQGPTVTQFGVEPGWDIKTKLVTERDASGEIIHDDTGAPIQKVTEVSRTRIRVNRITALQNDLALALAAPALRIEAPVPGKPMVGIEVPNSQTATVTMRGLVETPEYQSALKKMALPIALGAGVSGSSVLADLSGMPHLLIAGATGAGKSVCLNSIISGLLMQRSPEELRFVMIDPKRVELADFSEIPHLAFSRIIVEMDEVVGTLQAVINEMESRYQKFARVGVRNISSYNEKNLGNTSMPYWVVIIDELADLMIAAPYQVEQQLVRLAQLARATGIHLIVATQRPSVDVITGLIKANFPTRIAFAVASSIDSRTVLDQGGAEKLLGKGDMLYVPPNDQKPKRVQGVYVSDNEIKSLVDFWTADRFSNLKPENYDQLLKEAKEINPHVDVSSSSNSDPMLLEAIDIANNQETISTSLLQRRLRIGYPRAARIMDSLEEQGIVDAGDGSNARKVISHSDIQQTEHSDNDEEDLSNSISELAEKNRLEFPKPFDQD